MLWQETPRRLYLVTGQDLGPGERRLPGRWLARLGQAEPGNDQRTTEAVLEAVRSREFADCPARAQCCFACLSEEDAVGFAVEFGRLGHIYEVTSGAERVFVADMRWFSAVRALPATAEQSARSYWAGVRHPRGVLLEVLVPGDLTVSSRVRDIG